jgi:hypothetical protein
LAVSAKEAPALFGAGIFFDDRQVTPFTGFFGVGQPVLFEHEFFLPL